MATVVLMIQPYTAPLMVATVMIIAFQSAGAQSPIRLPEPSKTVYRCGNSYTDNEEEARQRNCKLVSADASVLEQLNRTGNYREVAANNNLKIFIDKSKAVREGKLLKSWSVLSYNKPQPLASSERYQSVQSLEYVDCEARTSATKRQVYYKDKATQGEVVGSIDQAFKFEQDPPGSMGELVMQGLCEK